MLLTPNTTRKLRCGLSSWNCLSDWTPWTRVALQQEPRWKSGLSCDLKREAPSSHVRKSKSVSQFRLGVLGNMPFEVAQVIGLHQVVSQFTKHQSLFKMRTFNFCSGRLGNSYIPWCFALQNHIEQPLVFTEKKINLNMHAKRPINSVIMSI